MEYQELFLEAVMMYRHPIVFDSILRICLIVTTVNGLSVLDVYFGRHGIQRNSNSNTNNNSSTNNNANTLRSVDTVLTIIYLEYTELCQNLLTRIIPQIIGELPTTQQECMSIVEGGVSSETSRTTKPTPIPIQPSSLPTTNPSSSSIYNNGVDITTTTTATTTDKDDTITTTTTNTGEKVESDGDGDGDGHQHQRYNNGVDISIGGIGVNWDGDGC